GNFQPGSADGEFGPATAAATKQAKWLLGYPQGACDEAFGPNLAGYLEGRPLPAAYKTRRAQRVKAASSQLGVRAKIVEIARWGAYPGHHVALVLEAGADPLLCSHGQEKGPIAIAFSVESKYQPTPAAWLSCL